MTTIDYTVLVERSFTDCLAAGNGRTTLTAVAEHAITQAKPERREARRVGDAIWREVRRQDWARQEEVHAAMGGGPQAHLEEAARHGLVPLGGDARIRFGAARAEDLAAALAVMERRADEDGVFISAMRAARTIWTRSYPQAATLGAAYDAAQASGNTAHVRLLGRFLLAMEEHGTATVERARANLIDPESESDVVWPADEPLPRGWGGPGLRAALGKGA